jgi:hypothetical protein
VKETEDKENTSGEFRTEKYKQNKALLSRMTRQEASMIVHAVIPATGEAEARR